MDAKKVFDEFNPKLVQLLPSHDPYFIAELTQQGLVSKTLKEEMMTTPTRANATTHFLHEVVERSLDIEDGEPFEKLLLIMEKFGDLSLNKLASKIKQRMTMSDSTCIEAQSNIVDSRLPKTGINLCSIVANYVPQVIMTECKYRSYLHYG